MTNFALSGMALLRAGKNVDEDFYSGMHLVKQGRPPVGTGIVDNLISGACCLINDMARVNFSANYATLSGDTKLLLEDMASNLAAIDMIKYNMDAYTSRVEAEDLVNVCRDHVLRGLSIIRDKKQQGFILRPSAGSA